MFFPSIERPGVFVRKAAKNNSKIGWWCEKKKKKKHGEAFSVFFFHLWNIALIWFDDFLAEFLFLCVTQVQPEHATPKMGDPLDSQHEKVVETNVSNGISMDFHRGRTKYAIFLLLLNNMHESFRTLLITFPFFYAQKESSTQWEMDVDSQQHHTSVICGGLMQ